VVSTTPVPNGLGKVTRRNASGKANRDGLYWKVAQR